MKIDKIFKIGVVAFTALFFSCERLLDENPPSNISIVNFYKSETDALAGLFGAYSNIYGFYETNAISYGDVIADDLTISPIVADAFDFDELTYNSNVTNGLWGNGYTGINRANEVIFYTGLIEQIDAGAKADIIAEAKALRAIYYWNLVRLMSDVPLYETPTVNFDEILRERAPQEQVYDLIISDLEEAVAELPSSSEAGRINSNIANALLARIHLYRGNYAGALAHARNVINSGDYDLFTDYADIFKPENDNGIEHIFQIQYLAGERANGIPAVFGPRTPNGLYRRAFWANTIVQGSYAPTADFVAENPDSYRKSVTISDSFEHIDGVTGTITMEQAFGAGVFPYYISKYDDRAAEREADANYNVIRYADILLIAAEASNEVDPGNNEKYTWINRVRERARNGVATDLPDLAGLTQEEFRTAVLEERRFELAFEGQRAWDLKRRGEFISKVTAQGKTVASFQLLFPIPENQIERNPNLTQNEGW